ncbi:MAG: lipoprotein-releasing system ATP-binding protein [Candidatus Pseudothioglobus sp.]|jgi:lipoprotein-releasing system ATP-binding protein|nr:ABC transporter ATP-binding protein [Gammaproteobacteria bacterium]MDB9934056.1 ABC transporter ATP-binding protein [Candidatus Thioglobus sp.]MDC1536341.1 ABC transporter ATP-binding protein [Candidatus Thioglobus sp.]MDC3360651.1 ABC transporter ATP-binding protein [Candidatus Thioglobus sp.]|tara:strand:- start:411 stop:1088 length:678 start_codon:yes stop_codon:yes gene_type:complete
MSNIIECRSVSFSYNEGNNQTSVLKNLNFEIKSGETTAIIGQSGCGKSTLLNLMAGLDTPTDGDVLIANTNISKISEKDRTELRAKNLGFVYQFHHLLNDFSSLYNVALPLLIMGVDKGGALLKSKKILTKVGLENRLNHKPSELSGGERQRVAIARAMITEPTCLLADEPTGNLDAANAKDVLELIIELNTDKTTALLIVTHDLSIANKMSRKLTLTNGEINET